MPTATENWSEHSFVQGESAERGFVVIEAADVLQAIAACNQLGASQGASYIRDNRLTADAPEVSHLGPFVYSVKFSYTRKDLSPPEDQSGGVDRRPTFDWEPALLEEVASKDVDFRPLTNMVGDVLDPPLMKTRPIMFLTYTRWDSAYDVQLALHFMGKKNSNALSIRTQTGDLTVKAGQMLCHSIRPAQAYRSTDRAVPIAYRFEFRETFDRRVLHAGQNAWYKHGNLPLAVGRICNAQGEPIAGMVRLDRDGKPVETSLKVLVNGTARTTSEPKAAGGRDVPKLRFDPNGGAGGTEWVLFDLIEDADFSALGL